MAQVLHKAPEFDMPSTKNLDTLAENVKLSDYKGKWVALVFYPLDFTFVCPTELLGFSERIQEFKELGCEVIGVSTDSVFSHRAWIKTSTDQGGIAGLNFPLASDITKTVSRDYGVLLEDKGIALRGLFIIDPDGVLQYAAVNSLNVGRSVDEAIRVIQALQTGGLCPVNWKPGMKTL
ncbi:MAG: peroxiredoxin [Blastocatellia bacterium]|nr:peroxiredoxin [Blastocatellia bacterium]